MDGNNLFKEDKLEEAMQQYEMVIDLFSFFLTFTVKIFGFQSYCGSLVKTLVSPFGCMGSTMIWLWQSKTHATYINMAACLIKLKRYDEAIGHCNIVRLIIPFIGRINHFLKI
ncbi:hypothetical protein YC2023_029052 [Brassica napus]